MNVAVSGSVLLFLVLRPFDWNEAIKKNESIAIPVRSKAIYKRSL
jgi:hypothetical protein